MERISKSVGSFFEEKIGLFKARCLVNKSDWTYVVGFKDGVELGDILDSSGFKGDPKLMTCDVIKRGIREYPSVCVTGFNRDDRMTGNVQIRRRI
ncbi:MAG: hypothetical protein KIH89_002545 [Candidatus Shapirobacteria bacterium]|nr:hypothetical protein [Candidatus Shapirobacteria bacterium]